MKKWTTIPTTQILEKTVAALQQNGIQAVIVETAEDAKQKVFSFIPSGSQVLTMTSVTLDSIGVSDEINKPNGKFISVRNALNSLNRETDSAEMSKLGAAPDYVVGSVHAVTENGEVLVASNTGSQLPAYLYGSAHVIWVVGAQKIVNNLDDAMKRLYEEVLPLENDRAHKAYGVEKSNVSKLAIFHKEVNPDRIKMILVKEKLGF